MVRIGLVGIGFMGRIHFLAARGLGDAQVTAICSRDAAKRKGDWTNTRGNFGPEPGQVDLAGVRTYEHLDDMLADPNIDMIDICNPTNLHPDTAIRALKAGKHVLVEKAIALQPDQADAMIEAAKNAGKLLMVAHVLPFFPEFAFATDAVRSGKYGKLLGGHFLRVIAKPDWSAEIGDTNATGGPAVDLHIHDTHFIGLIAGVPQSIFSTGQVDATGAVNYLNTSYLYGPGGPTITCSSGAIAAAGRPFIHGYEIYLEHATLEFMNGPLTVYTADGKSEKPKLLGGDDPISAFTVELQTAVDGIKNGTEPALLSGTLARDALVLCHREIESVKSGKILTIR